MDTDEAWAAVFEQARGYEVTLDDIRDTLSARRER